mmetsp:Transcript_486/g.1022  ORF Transcript_486/g.1022 Transcript_486/m.1022 type:complete len:235 (-) Transcript_486:1187-1891(-)
MSMLRGRLAAECWLMSKVAEVEGGSGATWLLRRLAKRGARLPSAPEPVPWAEAARVVVVFITAWITSTTMAKVGRMSLSGLRQSSTRFRSRGLMLPTRSITSGGTGAACPSWLCSALPAKVDSPAYSWHSSTANWYTLSRSLMKPGVPGMMVREELSTSTLAFHLRSSSTHLGCRLRRLMGGICACRYFMPVATSAAMSFFLNMSRSSIWFSTREARLPNSSYSETSSGTSMPS